MSFYNSGAQDSSQPMASNMINGKAGRAGVWNLIPFVWLVSIALVCYLSLMPTVEFPVNFENADLVYHTLSYVWLAFLPSFAFRRARIGLLCAILMIPLGLGLEFGQIAVPGRFFSVLDIGANVLGAIIGAVMGKFLRLNSQSIP